MNFHDVLDFNIKKILENYTNLSLLKRINLLIDGRSGFIESPEIVRPVINL